MSVLLRAFGTTLLALATVLAGGLSAACGGGGQEETPPPATSPPPVETAREISGGELRQMVLDQAGFGSAYYSFVLDDDSGFVSKEKRAEDAVNPADEEQDLDRFGYLNSYGATYSEPSLSDPEAPLPEEGPIVVTTDVSLFGDTTGATDYLADDLADAKEDVGAAYSGGRFESFEEFDVAGIGDAVWGGRGVLLIRDESGAEVRYHITGIDLQRGQLVGFVGLVRVDDEDVSAEAISLARKLDERIQEVLAAAR